MTVDRYCVPTSAPCRFRVVGSCASPKTSSSFSKLIFGDHKLFDYFRVSCKPCAYLLVCGIGDFPTCVTRNNFFYPIFFEDCFSAPKTPTPSIAVSKSICVAFCTDLGLVFDSSSLATQPIQVKAKENKNNAFFILFIILTRNPFMTSCQQQFVSLHRTPSTSRVTFKTN